jgi:hypothetical protein
MKLFVSENRRFLMQENGAPFFYLGDTAWQLFHRLTPAESVHYLEDRAAKKFTVIQAALLAELGGLDTPNANGDLALFNNDPTTPNEKYFQHADFVLRRANELGLVMGVLPTWGDKWNQSFGTGPEIFTPENAAIYGEWLGRRYRDYSLIWILGGDRPLVNETHRAIIEAMAAGLKAGEGARSGSRRHLMTFHPKNSQSSSQYFQNADWLDFNMLQSGHHGKDVPNDALIARDYAATPTKPCLDAEPCYESHPVIKPGWKERPLDRFDDYDVRKAAYRALFAGACGHTYGSHDIWMFWEPGLPESRRPRSHWRESLHLPGAAQMQHARALLESKPFFSRIPDQSLILKNVTPLYATRDEGNTSALIYFPQSTPATIDTSRFSGEVVASWFDPRDGSSQEIGAVTAGQHEFQPPGTETTPDWILVLDTI